MMTQVIKSHDHSGYIHFLSKIRSESNVRVLKSKWLFPFLLTKFTQKFLNKLLIFMNFYQIQWQVISSICSKDIARFQKTTIWRRAFWFNLYQNAANKINIH